SGFLEVLGDRSLQASGTSFLLAFHRLAPQDSRHIHHRQRVHRRRATGEGFIMKRRLCAALLVIGVGSIGGAPSLPPWGHEGHRLVALIAAKNLKQPTRARLATILGVQSAGLDAAMADAATWPDEINKKRTGTRDWHFIDVPVTAPFTVTDLCPNHDCV